MEVARIPLIMTRPEESSRRFIKAIADDLRIQFQIVVSPLIQIVPRDVRPEIGAADAVIFSSANGVRFAPQGKGQVAYCVGEATSRAAACAGWCSHCAGETSEALIATLIASRSKAKLWHLSGVHTRGDIPQHLLNAGKNITRVVLYDQAVLPLNAQARSLLVTSKKVIVPLFSPRTAQQFVDTCPHEATPTLLALSAVVAEPLCALSNASAHIVSSPTANGMMECLEKTALSIRLG